jgi:hypothetical protein
VSQAIENRPRWLWLSQSALIFFLVLVEGGLFFYGVLAIMAKFFLFDIPKYMIWISIILLPLLVAFKSIHIQTKYMKYKSLKANIMVFLFEFILVIIVGIFIKVLLETMMAENG